MLHVFVCVACVCVVRVVCVLCLCARVEPASLIAPQLKSHFQGEGVSCQGRTSDYSKLSEVLEGDVGRSSQSCF